MTRLGQQMSLWRTVAKGAYKQWRAHRRGDEGTVWNSSVHRAAVGLLTCPLAAGLWQWSITPQGLSCGFGVLRDMHHRSLQEHLRQYKVEDPLATPDDQPPELTVEAVREWIAGQQDRPASQWTRTFTDAHHACQRYLSEMEELDEFEQAMPGLWPAVQVHLWYMTGSEGKRPRLKLFPTDQPREARIKLSIAGEDWDTHLTFHPDRIDVRHVRAEPQA